MKLFKVDYTQYVYVKVNIDESLTESQIEEIDLIQELKKEFGEDNVSIDDGGNFYHTIQNSVFVGAINFQRASASAEKALLNIFDDGYEINGISEIIGTNIVNWGESDAEKCDCVFCRTKHASPEDIMTFNCSCKEEITVMNEQWGAIQCPKCGKVIMRDKIIDLPGGLFTFINIPNIEGDKFTDDDNDNDFEEVN